jgi:hypothetical protein
METGHNKTIQHMAVPGSLSTPPWRTPRHAAFLPPKLSQRQKRRPVSPRFICLMTEHLYGAAPLATSANWANVSASRTAMSARTLRFNSTPACFRP